MGNFAKFIKWQWKDIITERPQLLELADLLQAWWENGRTGDVLNVSMPTRFGKSLLASSFSVWLLLRDADTRILRASYAADLAETFSVQVKDQYLRFFEKLGKPLPEVTGTRARWSIGRRKQPNHAGVGVTGGITGFGFDIAIIDDTAKNIIEALSPAYSRTLDSFKDSVLFGRLEGKRKILNVGTRWTINDWFSKFPNAESYVLPALTEGGVSCCEAWKTTAELLSEKASVSDEVWQAQYMQRPTATGQFQLFKDWRPPVVEAPKEWRRRAIVIDPATDFGKDYFVAGDYAYEAGRLVLLDMFASKQATPEVVAGWIVSRGCQLCYCESNGIGRSVGERLRAAGVRNLVGFTTKSDKFSRAFLQQERVKDLFGVADSVSAEVSQELARQFAAFPMGDNDDLVDNIIMAFERIVNL